MGKSMQICEILQFIYWQISCTLVQQLELVAVNYTNPAICVFYHFYMRGKQDTDALRAKTLEYIGVKQDTAQTHGATAISCSEGIY